MVQRIFSILQSKSEDMYFQHDPQIDSKLLLQRSNADSIQSQNMKYSRFLISMQKGVRFYLISGTNRLFTKRVYICLFARVY